MRLTSPVFEDHGLIPAKYTCDGDPPAGGVNPPLVISDVPAGTKSLVLIVDDPDAPMGTWVHWTVWNIAPETREIAENSVPAGGVEGVTSAGKPGWSGPCPPEGEHRYFFKLFAIDLDLNLPPETTAKQLEAAAVGHTLGQAELLGRYARA